MFKCILSVSMSSTTSKLTKLHHMWTFAAFKLNPSSILVIANISHVF